MIPWGSLLTATAWVDFAVIVLSKFVPLTKALGTWYAEFGIAAVGADVLIIVLGIALAKLIFPGIYGIALVVTAVGIQLVHDILFYLLVIQGVPAGQNRIIDLFKKYAAEGSWKILVADAAMVTASVLLMERLEARQSSDEIIFLGILAIYSLIYILYTR
jgi:hypothetical protein